MDPDENTVTLMTIHSAKGLEFPNVFVVGMEEGVFPAQQADDPDQLEEERRLAYVAITRAKKRLILVSARQRMLMGQTASHRVSRFVDEIPPEHIDRPYADLRPTYFDFEDVPKPRAPRPPMKRVITAPAARPAAPKTDYAVGDRVKHNAFGPGVITQKTTMGGDALVVIEFENVGVKRLMLKAASAHMQKL